MSISNSNNDSKIDIIKESYNTIKKLGGNCIQIFISNPRGKIKKNTFNNILENANEISEFVTENNYKLFVHSSYILNLGKKILSPEHAYWIKSYYTQLQAANRIGAHGYVIHVGKHLDNNKEDSIKYMFISLSWLIQKIIKEKMNIVILLETPAGQGTELLTTLIDFANFYNLFTNKQKKYIKVCIDTCHIYSSGIDISSEKKIKSFFTSVKSLIGYDNIGLIHLNDSKTMYNSHLDRHEKLGKGSIGIENIKNFILYAKKYNIPIILETPDNGYLTEIPFIKKITK